VVRALRCSACALALALVVAPAAVAKTYRKGAFSVRAPAGYTLKRVKAGYTLDCGTAHVGVGRYTSSKSPSFFRDAAVKQLGLPVVATQVKSGDHVAVMEGVRSDGSARRAGVGARKRGKVVELRSVSYVLGQTPCSAKTASAGGPRARSAAVIDELSAIADTARGGLAQSIRLKSTQVENNTPIPLRRFEVCSKQTQLGQPPCTSALLPPAWLPNLGISPGLVTGAGLPASGFRGELVLGGNAAVYQNTCYSPFGNANGIPAAPYDGNPANAIVRVFPQQWAYAARVDSATIYTPISQVQVTGALRVPWLGNDLGPNGLYLVRWIQDGKPWTSVFGMVVSNTAPDACLWQMYYSFIAVPDDSPAGTATALVESWNSWRNSYQPTTEAPAGTAAARLRTGAFEPRSQAPPAKAAVSTAAGNLLPEVARFDSGPFTPRYSKQKLPDIGSIL
jgi:hypothetical protein